MKYASFAEKLLGLGLLDPSLSEPVEKTGMFFVKKKGGRQRLIFDCQKQLPFQCAGAHSFGYRR